MDNTNFQCQRGRLAGRYQGGESNRIGPSINNLLGTKIQTKSEKKAGKEVTIKFPGAVAKKNNRGTITSAQKAGRTAKAATKSRKKGKQVETIATGDEDDEAGDSDAGEPVQVPKPHGKPGPKAGTKRKRAGAETTSPRKC
jgi:hypothetical protein